MLVLTAALAGGASRLALEPSSSTRGERTTTAPIDGDMATPPTPTTRALPSPVAVPSSPRLPDGAAPAAPQQEKPNGLRIPRAGPGTFEMVRGRSRGGVATLTYTLEIERNLPFLARTTAEVVDATLRDDRGWVAVRGTTFRRVGGSADLRIILATPDTTDRLCAPLETRGRVSCRNGGLVVLNARRWAFGVPHYRSFLADYRRYLVNHEVGHALGEAHVPCPGPLQPAPVMLQQTYGLDGCRRNPWPQVA